LLELLDQSTGVDQDALVLHVSDNGRGRFDPALEPRLVVVADPLLVEVDEVLRHPRSPSSGRPDARHYLPYERQWAGTTLLPGIACTLAVTYLSSYINAMDAVLHALADESRRTVLEILRYHPASAGELAEALPIARPGVSRHLRVLR